MFRRYENLIVWGPFQPVDTEILDHVELEIGQRLPRDYRQFILATNGGQLGYSISLPPGDDGEPISFDQLRPVGRLAQGWRNHQEESVMSGLPKDLLPVADEGAGSRLYLDLRPESHGQVLAFVHGLPRWAGSDNGDCFGPAATDWNGYLEQLAIDEDFAELTWEDVRKGDDSPEDRAWRTAVVAWLDAGLSGWRKREWAG